jgi:predicted MFS family arabinose efflux permease
VKAKVLWAIGIAVGTALGTALYQLIRYGVSEVDWARAIFVAVFTCVVALMIPRRWVLR